jgi:hypothetical protein
MPENADPTPGVQNWLGPIARGPPEDRPYKSRDTQGSFAGAGDEPTAGTPARFRRPADQQSAEWLEVARNQQLVGLPEAIGAWLGARTIPREIARPRPSERHFRPLRSIPGEGYGESTSTTWPRTPTAGVSGAYVGPDQAGDGARCHPAHRARQPDPQCLPLRACLPAASVARGSAQGGPSWRHTEPAWDYPAALRLAWARGARGCGE